MHITESIGLVCIGNDIYGPGIYANAKHPISLLPKPNARYDFSRLEIMTGKSLGGGIKFVAGMQVKIPIIALGDIDSDVEIIVNYRSDKYWLLNSENHNKQAAHDNSVSHLANDRDVRSITRNLYRAPSQYVGRNPHTGLYNYNLSNGVFCHTMIAPGVNLPQFVGEEINLNVMQERMNEGRGGYFITLNEDTILDCYESHIANKCISSSINSAHDEFPIQHKETGKLGEINVEMIVRTLEKGVPGSAYYKTTALIPAHTELQGNYAPYIDLYDD